MNPIRMLASAFVCGGVFAVIGQVLLMAYGAALSASSPFVVPATLLTMGLIGAVLYATGLYQRIEDACGFGIILTFSGLAAAIAQQYEAALAQEAASVGSAVKSGLMVIVLVIGVGAIVPFLVGLLTFFFT